MLNVEYVVPTVHTLEARSGNPWTIEHLFWNGMNFFLLEKKE